MDEFPVDNTRLSAAACCDTQYVLRHKFGFVTVEGNDAANVGIAVHKGFEGHFRLMSIEDSLGAFRQEYYSLLGPDPVVDERLGYNNVETILGEWMRAHPVEKLPFIHNPQVVDVAVDVPLGEGFRFWAKIDLPEIQMKADGLSWIMDHKSTGKINTWWLKKFKLASQLTGYTWGEGRRTGRKITGALLNVVELSLLPSSSRKCKTHGVKYSECRAQHANWQVFALTRTEEVLQSWHRDALGLAKVCRDLLEWYPTVDYIPAIPQRGMFNGSCQLCDYLKFCQAGRPLSRINQWFKVEEWAPWDK